MQLQLPNGTGQLTPEQLQQLQNRQQALLAAQAQMRMRQQVAASVGATAPPGGNQE